MPPTGQRDRVNKRPRARSDLGSPAPFHLSGERGRKQMMRQGHTFQT